MYGKVWIDCFKNSSSTHRCSVCPSGVCCGVQCAVGAAAANIQIPILLGEATNVVSKFTSQAAGNFLEEIKKPAMKLMAVYALQVGPCFVLFAVYLPVTLFCLSVCLSLSICLLSVFVEEIKKPAMKLMAVYAQQIDSCFVLSAVYLPVTLSSLFLCLPVSCVSVFLSKSLQSLAHGF